MTTPHYHGKSKYKQRN